MRIEAKMKQPESLRPKLTVTVTVREKRNRIRTGSEQRHFLD